jgi:hypothetical protein
MSVDSSRQFTGKIKLNIETYYSVTPLPQEQVRHLQSVPHLSFGPLLGPSSPVPQISTASASGEVIKSISREIGCLI